VTRKKIKYFHEANSIIPHLHSKDMHELSNWLSEELCTT